MVDSAGDELSVCGTQGSKQELPFYAPSIARIRDWKDRRIRKVF